MPEVLQDAIQVILVGHTIIVKIEDAGLALVALDTNEVLLVYDFIKVAISVADGFRVSDGCQLGL